jgi:hypothetical protein
MDDDKTSSQYTTLLEKNRQNVCFAAPHKRKWLAGLSQRLLAAWISPRSGRVAMGHGG